MDGLEIVLRNMNKEIQKIENRTAGGLLKAALFIRGDMEAQYPLTPVKTGRLRSSIYTIPIPPTYGILAVQMGYRELYAAYQHENYAARRWTRPNSGPAWFQAALFRNEQKILEIIARNARIQ